MLPQILETFPENVLFLETHFLKGIFISITIILHENREHVPVVSTKYSHLAAIPGAAYPPRLGLAYLGQYLGHILSKVYAVIILKSEQNGWYFADDIFKGNFLTENCCILNKVSLKVVIVGTIVIESVFVAVIAWHRKERLWLIYQSIIIIPVHIFYPQYIFFNENA